MLILVIKQVTYLNCFIRLICWICPKYYLLAQSVQTMRPLGLIRRFNYANAIPVRAPA